MSGPFETPLPGVPSVESPFFTQIFNAPEIDAETRKTALELQTKGYAIIDFPDPDFDRIAEEIKDNLYSRYNWERYHAGANSLRLQDAWQFDENVRRLAANDQICDLLSTLYGRKAFPFQTLNFPVGTQQHFHTDSIHFSSAPERFMCGVWVALEDIEEDCGPLFYYPGSHKWPIFTNEHIGVCAATADFIPSQSIYEPLWEALVETYQCEPEVFLPRKGQALIWLSNLLHGGLPHLNRSKTRWSQVTHYFFEDCAYYTPMHSDPFYGKIRFRQLVDIRSGQGMPNRYAGQTVPDAFINFVQTTTARPAPALPEDFDPALYLAANHDVAASGADPVQHFLMYGWREKRPLRP